MGEQNQKPATTINIDLRLKSGQQTLADFASHSHNRDAVMTDQHENENPLPTASKNSVSLPSSLASVSKPAYPGAKHDVRGFCIRHPRCRLVRPVDGKEEGGHDPNDYRVVRKICHSCGEQSLVKKERKPTSHGFNPYNQSSEKKEPYTDAKLFTKVVPKSKSMAAKAPHFRKSNSDIADDKHQQRKPASSAEKLSPNNPNNSNTHVRSNAKIEVPPNTKEDGRQRQSHKNDESLQKRHNSQRNINHNKDEKTDKREGLQKQHTSQNVSGQQERKELHRTKTHSADSLLRQKSHNADEHRFRNEKKEDSLQRQKSQNTPLCRKNSNALQEERKSGEQTDVARSSSHEKKKEPQRTEIQSRGALHQNEKIEKCRSKSEDHSDEKILKRRSSARNPHQAIEATNSSEEAPSINETIPDKSSISKGSGEKNHEQFDEKKKYREPSKDTSGHDDLNRSSTRETHHKKHAKHPPEKSQVVTKVTHNHNISEKKQAVSKQEKKQVPTRGADDVARETKKDKHNSKQVAQPSENKPYPKTRSRSLSPHQRITRKITIAVTKEKQSGNNAPNASSRKAFERSKSVGHPQQRQRLASEFHYVHQQQVSHIPKPTPMSNYRSLFYEDVMAQSCLQSLVGKNVKT